MKANRLLTRWSIAKSVLVGLVGFGCLLPLSRAAGPEVPRWGRFTQAFQSSVAYTNPLQQARLSVLFTPPAGAPVKVEGFWDGGQTWRVRFAPNQLGAWSFVTSCSDPSNQGLQRQSGGFTCVPASGKTCFEQHGPIKVSNDGFSLQHDDGSAFFFLGDTAWNGPLLSSDEDWDFYLKERARQRFSAVQWVTTQWRAAPDGDINKDLAYTGRDCIQVNPKFFQRLDAKADAVNKAGLLDVPVLLWAYGGGKNPAVNPGHDLPESQAILLARYMVARWQANAVLYVLPGDGHYFGAEGDKWKRIGRAVFGEIAHAPVSLHPQGRHWNAFEFQSESWLGIIGYQSGHGDSDDALRWLTEGPVSKTWTNLPHRPFLNLEPPYEGHLAYESRKPISADLTRRTIYWSLLNAPTAGVSYGGHGVWNWGDGAKEPVDHPGAGTPQSWKKALAMPAAEQMTNLVAFFTGLDFWRLRPMPEAVIGNPGTQAPRRYIAAARTEKKDLLLVYVPEDRTVEILLEALPPSPEIRWWNPRTGEKSPAVAVVTDRTCQFPTPSEGDWLLVMRQQEKK